MERAEIEKRLQMVGFTKADADNLAEIRAIITGAGEELTGRFFDHLEKFDEARPLFADRIGLAETRSLKLAHTGAMVSGRYDTDYVDERLRLGAIYGKAGLPARLFIGAFQHMMIRARELIFASGIKDPLGHATSLTRVFFFDIALIVDAIVDERERVIRQQQAVMRDLSTPVLQVREGLLVVPLVGLLDADRAGQLSEALLRGIRERRARVAVIDITGVANVDSSVANHLIKAVSSARLMGVTTYVTGIAPDVAHSLVTLGVDLSTLNAVGDLEGGILAAEAHL